MTLTLPAREFFQEFVEEGDNALKGGKFIAPSQRSFDNLYEINGRMTCIFPSFSTVFQSYQDDGRVINRSYDGV